MRKFIMGCLGVVAALAAIQFAQADVKAGLFDRFSACGPCDAACNPCDSASDLGCGAKSGWFLGGHMEAGVYANEYGNKDMHYNGYTYPGNTDALQNVRNTGMQLNQGVIYFGKKANGRKGWDFGGRVDFMFGTDAVYAQSAGLEYNAGHGLRDYSNHSDGRWGTGDYYSALSQMYFEAEYKKLNIKVGKFLTPMGHEGLYSTDRFFYSLSDSFGMLPVTHSGALFTYTVNKKLTVFGGWVQGDNMFFDSSHNNAFLGGLRYDFHKRGYFKYAALIGRDTREYDNNGVIEKNDRDYFTQSFVIGYKPGKRWDYAFEWTLNNGKEEGIYNNAPDIFYEGAYGINQELIYKINKKWSVGLRAEWAHYYDCNHYSYANGDPAHWSWSVDKYTFTLAANWTPRSWITIRPEMRFDKFDGRYDYFEEKGSNGKGRNKQFSGGVSAIVKF